MAVVGMVIIMIVLLRMVLKDERVSHGQDLEELTVVAGRYSLRIGR